MKTIDYQIFDTLKALAVANESLHRAKMAAALVMGRRIISVGFNRIKSDPLQAKFAKNSEAIYLHAEVHAIKNALRCYPLSDIRKAKLYVCRVKRPETDSKDYVFGMACPCIGCRRAIVEFGIQTVKYTQDDGSIGTLARI